MLSARLSAFCLDVGASLIAEAGSDDLQIVEAALSAGDVGRGVFAVPEDSGNVEREALYEVGHDEPVSGRKFRIQAAGHLELAVSKVFKCNHTVRAPSYLDSGFGLEVVGVDEIGCEES